MICNMSNKIFKNIISICVINSLLPTIAIADQWQTRSELNAAALKVSTERNKPIVKKEQGLVKHKSLRDVAAGERLKIKAKINAKDGVKLARVYFKAATEANYSFVVLNKGSQNVYSADLPAADTNISSIEYKIVFQNAYGEIYKTEKYRVAVTTTAESVLSQRSENGFIYVYSELPEEDSQSNNFTDNIRYAYGVSKLSTQAGYTLSAANSSTGFISSTGGSLSAGAASSTALASSSTVASGVSAGSVAAGVGVVGAAAVSSPSGEEGDDTGAGYETDECYSGIIEHTVFESSVSVTQWTEIREGVPYGFSASNSVNGCLDDISGITTQFDADDKAEYQQQCLTKNMFESVFNDSGTEVSYNFVSNHGCSSVFLF